MSTITEDEKNGCMDFDTALLVLLDSARNTRSVSDTEIAKAHADLLTAKSNLVSKADAVQKAFNRALNFALDELDGYEAHTFLSLWREGMYEACLDEFGFDENK